MDGFWTAEFGSSSGMFGGGVAVFKDGRIMGGDAGYFYLGEYRFTGNSFKATLKISPFMQGVESVFKTVDRELTLDLEGSVSADGKGATAQGQARGIPDVKFGVRLTKRA